MKIPFSGGCACSAIRYECNAEPTSMFKCHCRDCQKLTSGGFAPAVLVPAQAFRLTRGQLRYHFTTSIARGKHKRGFCPECGSRVTGAESEAGDSPLCRSPGWHLGRPELVQAADEHFRFGRATVGSNGSDSEIRAVPAAIAKR